MLQHIVVVWARNRLKPRFFIFNVVTATGTKIFKYHVKNQLLKSKNFKNYYLHLRIQIHQAYELKKNGSRNQNR